MLCVSITCVWESILVHWLNYSVVVSMHRSTGSVGWKTGYCSLLWLIKGVCWLPPLVLLCSVQVEVNVHLLTHVCAYLPTVFCTYYSFDGLFRERGFESIAYILGVVAIVLYVVVNYVMNQQIDHMYKLVRLYACVGITW